MKFTDFILVTSINILSYGIPIGFSLWFSARMIVKEIKKKN